MRSTCLTILGLILFPFFVSAQNLSQTIRGTITDTHSQQALTGAYVIIDGTDPIIGSVTGLEGDFRINDVPVGRHTLRISYIGYEDLTIPELLLGSGKELILDVELTESITSLEEIVIIADNQDKGDPLNEMASISAMSFNVEETGRFAATFDDPARAAMSFAGVRGAGDDIMNEIVIRGNSPRGLLWRIEGVEVPNPNHFGDVGSSAGGISMLSNNMLSRSDFYTGAFPAEYGNALSGVFDINLRNGNNEKREYAIEAGLIGLQVAAEGPLNSDSRGSYLANYRYSTLAVLNDLGILPLLEEDTRFSDLSFKINMPTDKAGTFSLWGLGGLSSDTYNADPAEEEYFNDIFEVKMGVIGLKHVRFLDANTFIESSISASSHLNTWSYDSMSLFTDQSEDFENRSLRFTSLVNRKFSPRNTARFGVILSQLNYDYHSFYHDDNQVLVTDVDDQGSMSRFQTFAQWQHRLSEEFSINMGLHYNRLNLNGQDSFEPRIGARMGIAPGQYLSAGFGIHSRTETPVIYLAQRQDENGVLYQPNKNLDMTKAIHYVIGYENKSLPDIRFKVEAYYQDLYDVIVVKEEYAEEDWMKSFSALNTTSGYTSLPLSNNGNGYNYGLELTVEKFFTRSYYFLFTGSFFQSKYHGVDAVWRNTRFNGNYTTNILAGKEFKVGRQKNNMIGVNGKVIWAGNNRTTPIDLEESIIEGSTVYIWEDHYSERLDDYLRFDIGISYRKNKPNYASIITLNVQNITNRLNEGGRYFSDYSYTVQSWEQLGILPNLSYRIEF